MIDGDVLATTKILILLRHAKSARPPGVVDHDRPLAPRGRAAAEAMGRFIKAAGWAPDTAVASTARRAEETLRLAAASGEWRAELRSESALYDGGPGDVLAVVRRQSEPAQRLVLVGHEPTWSEVLAGLTGGGRIRFPTGAAACVDLGVESWGEADGGSGELMWLVVPRLLTGDDG